MKKILVFIAAALVSEVVLSQSGPWERPLIICEGTDGTFFSNCHTFQDSSGVPSAIRWKGDTLVAVFQWFPAPKFVNPAFDKVAVKFSYNGGASWTFPASIVVTGLPPDYQRPFDPTLFAISRDSIRLYFSDGVQTKGFDSSITTHSAVSTDGINYMYEQGKRFISGDTTAVIDPAVIRYKGMWHFQSHKGAPQDGSYHGISGDGLNFTRVQDITSDAAHSWLGNYVTTDSTLRFYGNGQQGIWFNTSYNGGVWNGYTNTNINGGDPTVVQNQAGRFYLIYTGEPYNTGISESGDETPPFEIFPNPSSGKFVAAFSKPLAHAFIKILNTFGQVIYSTELSNETRQEIKLDATAGMYFICVSEVADTPGQGEKQTMRKLIIY